MGANHAKINTLFLCLVWSPNSIILGITLIGVYGLNLPEVGKILVPSIPVKFSQTDISVEI